MKTSIIKTAILSLMIASTLMACKKDMSTDQTSTVQTNLTGKSSGNGTGTQMPAYYDAQLFTITFMELSPQAEQQALANSQLNNIYQYDPGLAGGSPFISVIDAVPGDGMNPLWREIQIVFNPGYTPHQFFSDDEIDAAVDSGEITLAPTDEVYICSVVGSKH